MITITSVTPNDGLEVGNTLVTVAGSDFVDGATVAFESLSATGVTVVSSSEITCKTPPGLGVVDVVVTNPDLSSATLAGGFSYGVRQTAIVVPLSIGDGLSSISRSSPGLGDILNKIALNLSQLIEASQQDDFSEFKLALEDLDTLQVESRPRYVTAYQSDSGAIKIPERMGEGLSGMSRENAREYIGLFDVLGRISLMLDTVKAASQLANFATFKLAMADLPELLQSDDSTV